MRVLLTNAPLDFYHRTAFFFRDQGAINLAILATAIEKKHEVSVLDNWHYLLRFEGIFREIERFKPDVVGISHSSEVDSENVYAVARKIKKLYPSIIVIGGGQSPTMFPEETLANGFDFVVRGEGEHTFPELMDAISEGRSLRAVKAVAYIENGEFVDTGDRPACDISQTPYPALKFLPKFDSWYFPGKKTSVIETARGCPFHCDFCIVTAYFQSRWSRRSNDSLIAEIKNIKGNLGVDHFYFTDESWGIKPDAYGEFCQRIIDEKLDIKWWPSGLRTDTIVKNPELIKLAGRAGMYGSLVGFESYTEKTLSDVHKQSSIANNRKASDIMKANNMIVYGVHIYGLPGETDFYPTYNEGRKRSDIFCISMFSCLPGTPLFKRAEKEGVLEKIPVEERLYPYSYWMNGEGRDKKVMTRNFMLWHLRYHVSPRNLLDTLFSTGVRRRFKLADYVSCLQYALFFVMRKLHNWKEKFSDGSSGGNMIFQHVIKDHVAAGLIVGLILTQFWSLSNCLIFWLSTVLVDIDHYLNLIYWSKFKTWSVFKTVKFYAYIFEHRKGRPFLALEVFHTAEFIGILFFLAFFTGLEFLKPVFFGIAFHVFVDFFHLRRLGALRVRNHSILEYMIRKRAMSKQGLFPVQVSEEAGHAASAITSPA